MECNSVDSASSKEEEEQHTGQRQKDCPSAKLDPELVQYVADRLRKLKPSKKNALFNSIAAMFQFQGDISECFLSRRSEIQYRKSVQTQLSCSALPC